METTDYIGIEPVITFDSELDKELEKCKTEEERDELIDKYVSVSLTFLGGMFAIMLVIAAVFFLVIYLF